MTSNPEGGRQNHFEDFGISLNICVSSIVDSWIKEPLHSLGCDRFGYNYRVFSCTRKHAVFPQFS